MLHQNNRPVSKCSSNHFFLRIALTFLLTSSNAYAGMHPIRVAPDANCVECHADHADGAYVHAPVKQGCLACHTISNREDAAYILLKPAKTVICLNCHQAEEPPRTHFPYGSGMCLRCHNPHTSNDSRLLVAKANEICLDCHLRRPGNSNSQYMPTIALSLNNTMGHPYERHPVSGVIDPLTGSEMSCLSCHLAHGGTMPHYLKMGAEIPEDALNQNVETNDMCHKCHMRLWGLDGPAKKKKKSH